MLKAWAAQTHVFHWWTYDVQRIPQLLWMVNRKIMEERRGENN
jgi:hypothetical protein